MKDYFFSRYSNTLYSEGKNGKNHIFRHPFLQTWGLSLGEFACFFITIGWNFWKGRATKNDENDSTTENNNEVKDAKTQSKEELAFSPFIFLPAAIFHQGSRCLIFMALIFTTASSYQILSGSNLIFACIFSKIFLKKVLPWHKWIGVLIIIGKKTWSHFGVNFFHFTIFFSWCRSCWNRWFDFWRGRGS